MLSEICREIRNWFDINRIYGTFIIKDGELQIDEGLLQKRQYFRIVGSVFNDGVYQYPDTSMTDETFEGAIWVMAIPEEFLQLANEIDAWCRDNSELLKSPYASESYGGYSYSRATSASGRPANWQDTFASRLNRWKKL